VPWRFGLVGLPADQHMPDTERVASLMAVFDAGRLVQTLVLAAWSRGIASCPATMHDQGRARAILGIPEEQWVAMALGFGYPVEETQEQREYVTSIIVARGRRPLGSLVHYDAWDAKPAVPAGIQGGER
jgi:nitroreductase